jgi:hypothetical protein
MRNTEGQFTFTVGDRYEVVNALKEIFLTPIGESYKQNFYTEERGEEDLEKILRAAKLVVGGPNITVAAMTRGLELLIDSGEIQPKDFTPSTPLEEPVEDTRPRDKNGKLLNESQLRYKEYREFSERASMAEVNKRKQTDAGYASYIRKQLASEMNQPVGDAVIPEGQANAQRTSSQVSGDLVNFVHAFRAELSQNLKPKGGYVTLAGRQIPYSHFIEQVDAATAAGLL